METITAQLLEAFVFGFLGLSVGSLLATITQRPTQQRQAEER
jgi:hypothetical protein